MNGNEPEAQQEAFDTWHRACGISHGNCLKEMKASQKSFESRLEISKGKFLRAAQKLTKVKLAKCMLAWQLDASRRSLRCRVLRVG